MQTALLRRLAASRFIRLLALTLAVPFLILASTGVANASSGVDGYHSDVSQEQQHPYCPSYLTLSDGTCSPTGHRIDMSDSGRRKVVAGGWGILGFLALGFLVV